MYYLWGGAKDCEWGRYAARRHDGWPIQGAQRWPAGAQGCQAGPFHCGQAAVSTAFYQAAYIDNVYIYIYIYVPII